MELMSDTICAICTPIGVGSVAVIRISGPSAIKIAKNIFKPLKKSKAFNLEPKKVYLGHIVSDGTILDESICLYFKSPNSLTGQDVVEFHTHGGLIVPSQVLKLLIKNGSRVAEPGEFSFRSYQNGKIDLVKAEAVAGLISSQSEAAAACSTKNISGEISKKYNDIRELGIDLVAEIEARVDFPEDEIPEEDKKLIGSKFDDLIGASESVLGTYKRGRLVIDGIRVLLLGEPNTGKSTLLNSMLMEDKAIVSSTPGTTRDILDANIIYKGQKIILSDTAGIRKTFDEVEIEGIKRAKAKVEFSDLVLIVVDSGNLASESEEIGRIFDFVPRGKRILIANKSDLYSKIELSAEGFEEVLSVSAKNRVGILPLLDKIVGMKENEGSIDFDEGIVTTERQMLLLEEGLKEVKRARSSFDCLQPNEITSIHLRLFLDAISKITGEISNEQIYDQLFSKFCIGK
jgi:tRNA modification GTPase